MIERPNRLTIDLSALVHNLNQVRSLTGDGVRVMGIVKSDAYGHGLLPVARALEKNGVDALGVAHLHEALLLRDDGIRLPVVILSGIQTREEIRETVARDLTPVLFDLETAESLAREGLEQGKRTRIHLKLDSGMGRLGIGPDDVAPFLRKILTLKGVKIEALLSHLSCADVPEDDFTTVQVGIFRTAVAGARSLGLDPPLNNLANSAAVMDRRNALFSMVRAGIMLYGGLPRPGFRSPVPLKPAMRLKTRILQVREMPAGTPISYGRTYYTEGPRRIAILSAGYGDGLPRRLSNRGKVLIRGRRAPIVGRICMNLTVCDVTNVGHVEKGEEAVLLGPQGKDVITGDDLARWADTISYEVFCSIGHHNPKEYVW